MALKVEIILPLGHNLLSNLPSGLQLLQPVSIMNQNVSHFIISLFNLSGNKSTIHQL